MPLYGFNFAKLATNISSGVSIDWTATTGCLFANDSDFANSSIIAGGSTALLKASNFGFNIPTTFGYQLQGITVTINKRYNPDIDGDTVRDVLVQLIDASGNLIGNNKASSGQWTPNTFSDISYGGQFDEWNIDPGNTNAITLIPNLINTSGFGVMIQGEAIGMNQDSLQINSVSIQVNVSNNTPTSFNSSFPLFIRGLDSGNANIPLYTVGSVPFSGGIPLFTKGFDSFSGGIPLFLDSATPFSGGIPLYLDGGPHISVCYNEVFPTSISTISGLVTTPWANTNNLFILDNSRATCTFNSGNATSDQLKLFFNISGLSTQAVISGVTFNFYKQQNVGDDSVTDLQVFLIEHGIVQSGVNYAGGIWGTSEHSPVNYTINTDQNGTPLTYSDITASGFGVLLRAGTNNFGAGFAQIDSVSCTVCATVPGFGVSLPLFLSVSNSISGGLPLFIQPSVALSGSLPLFMDGLDNISGNLPLYTVGYDSISGSLPLYLAAAFSTPGLPSSSIPLYIAGHIVNSGGITLYLQGDPTHPLNNSIPLYLGNYSSTTGVDSLRNTFPLFLDAHNFGQGITLYMGVSNIGTPEGAITLFTKGENLSLNGNIPLFLCNSGLTARLPLYTKGLSTGNNPFVNSDGFYPIEGGITLFIKTLAGGGIPLHIGSNFSTSGNIPLYLECNNQFSGGIPLYLSTSVAQTHSIPLYHHGF